MATSNLTIAAKLSQKAHSSLLSCNTSKQRVKTESNYINTICVLCFGFLVGYSVNYIYNEYYCLSQYEQGDDDNEDNAVDDDDNKQQHSIRKTQASFSKSLSSLLFTTRKKKRATKSVTDIHNEKQLILKEFQSQIFKFHKSPKRKLLFISNECQDGYKEMKRFLGNNIKKLLLIPYGHEDLDEHTEYMKQRMWEIGKFDCTSIHCQGKTSKAIRECDAIIIANGNVYKLLSYLYHYKLMNKLQKTINSGKPYIGIGQCGISVACTSIQTSFQIPIVQPPSFKSLSIIPFHLVANFDDLVANQHDFYDQSIREFLKEHQSHHIALLGLYKNCYLEITNNRITLKGTGDRKVGATLYRDYSGEAETVCIGGLLSSLLH